MQTLNNYIKEQFKDDTEIVAFINSALEQYFQDHNKELFLATLKEVIISARWSVYNCKTGSYQQTAHI